MKGGPEYVEKSLTYRWFSYVSWVVLAGIGPLPPFRRGVVAYLRMMW